MLRDRDMRQGRKGFVRAGAGGKILGFNPRELKPVVMDRYSSSEKDFLNDPETGPIREGKKGC